MAGYLKASVETYLKELSAREIVPGGGSASALTAALGAGLNLMVINFSLKDTAPEDVSRILEEAGVRQKESLKILSELVDEDCRVFRELMKALSSKRDARKEYTAAAMVPLDVCRQSSVSIGITASLRGNANRHLLSDIKCAANFLKAAFRSAKINVEVNLKKIEDGLFVDNTRRALEDLEKDVDDAWQKLLTAEK